MKPARVALIGKLGSGKTTVASVLEHEHGYVRLPFAQALKEEAVTAVNLAMQQSGIRGCWITLAEAEKRKEVFRTLFQWWGTDLYRNYLGRTDEWVNRLADKLDALDPDTPVVVDDLRFDNEWEMLEQREFTFVRVARPENERLAYLRTKYAQDALERALGHESERAADTMVVDMTIANGGTEAELRHWAGVIGRALKGEERAWPGLTPIGT